MRRALLALMMLFALPYGAVAQSATSELTRLLEADLARYPARAGVYVKNLRTGEEAMVNADQSFSSASVIKVPIMIRAFQLADQVQNNRCFGRIHTRSGLVKHKHPGFQCNQQGHSRAHR